MERSGHAAHMSAGVRPRARNRGEIEALPSGSLRVRVYAGVDPVSKKRHYLTETIPSGPQAARLAEKARTRLLAQVDERRNARTKATVNQLMDRYLEVLNVERTTRTTYEGYIQNHIRPLLGNLGVHRLDGEVLDSFYSQLRTCRAHCRGRVFIEHRTSRPHDCDDRCRPHQCRPLKAGSIRYVHSILSGALTRAVRWRWIGSNPIEQVTPPATPKANPDPPTAEQAARIVNAAWRDPDWGMLVWLAMVTGARRGELCALAWDRLDFATDVLTIRTSIAQNGEDTWEKETKTHQQRRIVLDEQTLALLRAYHRRCVSRAEALGLDLPATGRLFSRDPDGATWLRPHSVAQRYARMCARLGWDMNPHQLRHYSATELIASGVDVRTVAGRLGHGGGGATTLRVYSAWRSEADQRAAGTLVARLPEPPIKVDKEGALTTLPPPVTEDSAPYRRIAADLQAAIKCGALQPGQPLPTEATLAERYGVAPSTAHRAIVELTSAGLAIASRGKRAQVAGQ